MIAPAAASRGSYERADLMRLSKWQVELLSFEVARDILKAGLVTADAERLEKSVIELIAEDLTVEDRLDIDVTQILKDHADTMRQTGVDYATMFEKVKKQLVRERKLVL